MKRILIIGILIILCSSSLIAQRFAYVDSEYVLKKLPEYKRAQDQLESIVKDWEKEIMERQEKIDKLSQELENEKILLTTEQVKEKQGVIDEEKASLYKLREKRFGSEGDLFLQQKLLVKPVQDLIWNAVNKIASKKKYDFVFDKAGGLVMLRTNSKWDISDNVIEVLNKNKEKYSKRKKRKKKLIQLK